MTHNDYNDKTKKCIYPLLFLTHKLQHLKNKVNERTPFFKIISSSMLLILSIIVFKCSMLRWPVFLELHI